MRIRRLIVCFVLTLGIFTWSVGCGPSGEPTGNEYSAETAPEFFKSINKIDRLAECKTRFECPRRFGQPFATTTNHNTYEACESGESYFAFTPAARRDLADGRIEYQQQLGQRCIDEYAELVENIELQCDQPPPSDELSPECRDGDFLVGTVSKDGSCRTSIACEDGLTCDAPENACGGSCVESTGQPGDDSDDKQSGASCGSDSECATTLACAPDTGGPASGNVCIEWYSRGEGDACDSDLDCEPQLTCNEGTCAAYNLLSEGETCDTGFGSLDLCGPGLHCFQASGESEPTCQRFVEEGESCSADAACAGSLYCVDGTCQPPKPAGESCSSDAECGSRPCRSNGECAPFGDEACYPSDSN
jgi:hypothetical protein